MSIFIGGDTASINYSFDLAVAGDSSYPMKLYRSINGIDVNIPDAPTSGGVVDASKWSWIQDSRTLDKLKAQNEIPITSVNFTNRTAIYNGVNLVLQTDTIPAVRDDFLSKTTGNTITNPNISKYCTTQTNLQIPSSANFTETEDYTNIATQNSVCISRISSSAGQQPQQLYSFNIVLELESKYGSLPCANDIASKVAWLKANISKLIGNWTGYGGGQLGNKANFAIYAYDQGLWATALTNTSSNPSLLSKSTNYVNAIDNNGFVHFLAYADQARTTDSTLLVLTGHGLTNLDLIENVTRNKYAGGLIINGSNYITLASLNAITDQTSGDIINKYKATTGYTATTGTTSSTLVITNHGLSNGDYIYNATRPKISKINVVDSNTLTCLEVISNQSSGDNITLLKFFGQQTAEATVIPSTIFTDYISLDIQLKSTVGYDLLVPSNSRRDNVINGNYDNIVMAEKVYNQVVSDYTGKIAGSVVENPNLFKLLNGTSLSNPTGFTVEWNTSQYANISTLNGVTQSSSTSSLNNIPQQLFQFNLISIFEKQYGTIPATDKVSWLKSNISSVICDWFGYGSCPSGNKAYLQVYQTDVNTWSASGTTNNTASIPTLINFTFASVANKIDSNGICSFIAYTSASDGTTPSTIYTDYIKLTLTFNNGNNSLEYFTNNSVEMAVQTTSKTSANLISIDTTAICSALYGASNSALLSAFKVSSSFDIYAQGYGANGNDITNGVNYFAWNGTSWVNLGSNLTNAISKVTCILNNSNFIQSNNQIYIMVVSKYNSTTDVPSSVSIDWLTVNVQLVRANDVITPITITL